MRPEYLAGIKTLDEILTAPVQEHYTALKDIKSKDQTSREVDPKPWDEATAIDLATTMKTTAGKLFDQHFDGTNMLGALAVQLEEAADKVLTQLRNPQLPGGRKKKPGPTPGKKSKRKKKGPNITPPHPIQGTIGVQPTNHFGTNNGEDIAV
jgi:hypothetical protein